MELTSPAGIEFNTTWLVSKKAYVPIHFNDAGNSTVSILLSAKALSSIHSMPSCRISVLSC